MIPFLKLDASRIRPWMPDLALSIAALGFARHGWLGALTAFLWVQLCWRTGTEFWLVCLCTLPVLLLPASYIPAIAMAGALFLAWPPARLRTTVILLTPVLMAAAYFTTAAVLIAGLPFVTGELSIQLRRLPSLFPVTEISQRLRRIDRRLSGWALAVVAIVILIPLVK